ncbi:NAD kinase [Gracilibacillus alcaliphilus]|uniref:NAD kinase n=1 Tax=Gracilibacillus alcaliphilus TaxID=1401441 RepID=UPI00195E0632|nr:NAD kinase [Gracilibacillus alcaliphilus]MBM7676880.1 NAD+ kinase [Gracilibacillus alcaliphilus]
MDSRSNIYFFHKNNQETLDKLTPLVEDLKKHGFNIVEKADQANIVISFGGDGEFLQAVRKSGFRQNCVYLGITHSDESGLYCDFDIDNYDRMVNSMMTDNIEVREFPIIDVTINDQTSFQCLNDVTIRSTIIKTIEIDVLIDDQYFESFRGDGLVVSTPTGSTGYSKSTDGAVIDPKIPCFQVSEVASLNNNRYRTLGSSFILNEDRKLRLEVIQDGNDYPIVGLDNEAHPIQNIHSVSVELSDKRIKTVKLKDNSFWDRVQRTFL